MTVTIPTSVVLSLIILKIRYQKMHYLAIFVVLIGISLGLINDFVIKEQDDSNNEILGIIFAFGAAIAYACENIIMEHLVIKPHDLYHFMGWVGLFGSCFGFIEAGIFGDYKNLSDVMDSSNVIKNFT